MLFALRGSSSRPSNFFRYVDDCLAVFNSRESLFDFFHSLNSIHPNIKFTYESNASIPFLDIFIQKSDNKLNLSIYRKPTSTDLYTHWNSFIPTRYKINLITCLIDRAYKICNSYQAIHQEFQNITKRLLKNGYPQRVIDNVIRKYLNNKHAPTTDRDESVDENPSKLVFFKLPFLGDTSYHIEKELKSFLQNKVNVNFKLIMTHSTSPIRNLFRHKHKQQLLHLTGVVYEITCSCGGKYIGQTKRNLLTRLAEHRPAMAGKSDVADHLHENPDHIMDFNNPKVLARDSNYRKLLIKETLFMQQNVPTLNSDTTSHPLFLFNL